MSFFPRIVGMITVSVVTIVSCVVFVPLSYALDTRPNVVATTPGFKERVVSAASSSSTVPIIVVLFDQAIKTTSSSAATISVINSTDGVAVHPTSVAISDNSIYFTTGGLVANKDYTATIHASSVVALHGGLAMDRDYVWSFKTARVTVSGTTVSEPIAHLNIQKSTTTSAVTINGSNNASAIYRITLSNDGEYNLNNITIQDALPTGFSFASLVGGDPFTVSAITATSSGPVVTFRLGHGLGTGGAYANFDFKVNISGNLDSSGNPVVPPQTYHNTALVKASFEPMGGGVNMYGDYPTVSIATDNRGSGDDVTISRFTSTTPPPRTVSHPSIDPLTCLGINGISAMSFSDVSAADLESPYVRFLNTTVFSSHPSVRLVQGYGNGVFGMNSTLTRFELTKMALASNCVDYLSGPVPNTRFVDVPTDNSELSLVIGKAYALGIVQGVGNRFFPNQPVSYAEMVKILIGSGVYFSRGTPTGTVLPATLNGITDESFRQFAEYTAAMNLLTIRSDHFFPQNEFVLRRYMAQAMARYIAWLKNISLP